MRWIPPIGWLIVAVALTPFVHAETDINCSNANCVVFLKGEIGKSDVRAFQEAARSTLATKKGDLLVSIDSDGGDVDAAIEIGRILRSVPTSYTLVTKNNKCLSACVLVLAGGHMRTAQGSIGIHQAFSTSNRAEQFGKANERFAELRRKIRDYLDFVNIPLTLFDAMQRVPANDIRILSAAEIQQFGLSEIDPVYRDVVNSKEAGKYGLTKIEYLSRKSEAQLICRDIKPKLSRPGTVDAQLDAFIGCVDGVMRGSGKAPN